MLDSLLQSLKNLNNIDTINAASFSSLTNDQLKRYPEGDIKYKLIINNNNCVCVSIYLFLCRMDILSILITKKNNNDE